MTEDNDDILMDFKQIFRLFIVLCTACLWPDSCETGDDHTCLFQGQRFQPSGITGRHLQYTEFISH